MSKFNRMHLVVLDSVGIGAAPDANDFVNAGVPDGASDTLGHISKSVGLNVPNMAKLGLGNIPRETPLKTVPAESNPIIKRYRNGNYRQTSSTRKRIASYAHYRGCRRS